MASARWAWSARLLPDNASSYTARSTSTRSSATSSIRRAFRRRFALTKRHGAYVIPNLSTFSEIARQWGNRARLDSILARPDMQYLDPVWRERWAGSDYVNRKGSVARQMAFLRTFTKALSDSGVPMLLGTDSPMIPGLFPGSALQLDLDRLLEAGLTPYQILAAGTRAPGAFIARELPDAERCGTIAPGMRADLLLLEGNPRQNLDALKRPLGVMVRGRWLSRASLDSMVNALRVAPRP